MDRFVNAVLILGAMRPLFHPAVADISVEGVLHALADPVRAQIFAEMAVSESARTCSTFLELSERSIAKSTLSQHFKVLREAGLIRSERKGVELHNTTRCNELRDRFGVMVNAIIDAHRAQDQKLKKSRRAAVVKAARKR